MNPMYPPVHEILVPGHWQHASGAPLHRQPPPKVSPHDVLLVQPNPPLIDWPGNIFLAKIVQIRKNAVKRQDRRTHDLSFEVFQIVREQGRQFFQFVDEKWSMMKDKQTILAVITKALIAPSRQDTQALCFANYAYPQPASLRSPFAEEDSQLALEASKPVKATRKRKLAPVSLKQPPPQPKEAPAPPLPMSPSDNSWKAVSMKGVTVSLKRIADGPAQSEARPRKLKEQEAPAPSEKPKKRAKSLSAAREKEPATVPNKGKAKTRDSLVVQAKKESKRVKEMSPDKPKKKRRSSSSIGSRKKGHRNAKAVATKRPVSDDSGDGPTRGVYLKSSGAYVSN